MKKMSFATACVQYFGRLPGQGLTEFQAELKKLTEKDRADLTKMFLTVDIEITPNP